MMKWMMKVRLFWARVLLWLGMSREVYYIGKTDTLPPPLSAEEEAELIANLDTDKRFRSVLVERNLRLVVYIAKKFENTGIGMEDLISIGTIGLMKAANTFLTRIVTRLSLTISERSPKLSRVTQTSFIKYLWGHFPIPTVTERVTSEV